MKAYSITDVGCVRSSNEDCVFASTDPVGELPNLFVLADGMGGHAAGECASRHAVEAAFGAIRASELRDPAVMISEAITTANEMVYLEARSDSNKAGMGTTMVVATIVGQHLYVGNVGDSRLYLLHDKALIQITRDHSLVAEMKQVMDVDEETMKAHKNYITRAVGAERSVRVDTFEIELSAGDEILLCSDGLTNMVEDAEIESTMARPFEVKAQATHLVEMAKENGGKDNVSVIVISEVTEE